MTISKKYSSKTAAKKALHRIFKSGNYSSDGTYAEARFCSGQVSNDGKLTLSSTYWTESSLHEILKKGIDAV